MAEIPNGYYLILDTETRSDVDLVSSGVYQYSDRAARPDRGEDGYELLLVAYRTCISGMLSEVQLWEPFRDPAPDQFIEALTDPRITKIAHNAAFDRVVLSRLVYEDHSQFLPPEQWLCTLVTAAACGLPRSLDRLATRLGVSGKMPEGSDIIRYFNQFQNRLALADVLTQHPDTILAQIRELVDEPVPQDANIATLKAARAKRGYTQQKRKLEAAYEARAKWVTYREYNRKDVEVLTDVWRRMPPLSPTELRYWHIDQNINDYGVLIDMDLAAACGARMEQIRIETTASLQKKLNIENPRSVQQFRSALDKYLDVQLPSLNKETVAATLADPDASEVLKTLLTQRADISATSVKKVQAMANRCDADGVARGNLQFLGAHTGRWAGRGIQFQNLPRIPSTEVERTRMRAENLNNVKTATAEEVKYLLRACVVAPPGNVLTVADYSAIEARVLAWLAGEQWVLNAFSEGQDIYKATWSRMSHTPIEEVTPEGRQRGKVAVLALGYGGGVAALRRMGGDRLPIPPEFDAAHMQTVKASREHLLETLPDRIADARQRLIELESEPSTVLNSLQKRQYTDIAKDTQEEWERLSSQDSEAWAREQHRRTLRHAYLDMLKRTWRETNPLIVQFWSDLDTGFRAAAFDADPATAGPLNIHPGPGAGTVRIELPSQRILWYHSVRVAKRYNAAFHRIVNEMTFLTGIDSREGTYHGKLTENVTQAVARDLLAYGIAAAEDRDIQIVMHVHDEIIAEGSVTEELTKAMTTHPDWATGLPLDVEAVESPRYLGH